MRNFLVALVCVVCFAPAVHAAAANVYDLRTLFGITVGDFTRNGPLDNMTSLGSNLPCRCEDFCRFPPLGDTSQTTVTARWTGGIGHCGADMLTVEMDNPLGAAALESERLAPIFQMTAAQIIARYGMPSVRVTRTDNQIAYCDLADPTSPDTSDILYVAFRLVNDRVAALRIVTAPTCPQYPFLPPG